MSKNALTHYSDWQYTLNIEHPQVKDQAMDGNSEIWILVPGFGVDIKLTFVREDGIVHVDIWDSHGTPEAPINSLTTYINEEEES